VAAIVVLEPADAAAVSSNPENVAERQAGDAATPRITITASPIVDVAVDDDGARHAALLAANAERNAANAARRAELVERAREIAERRAGEPTSTRPRSAGVKPALADRLAALLAGRSGDTA
jgi:RNA 3'-terminal phosphate cyclase